MAPITRPINKIKTGSITTDKSKLYLILMSLVGNAINFTEKGSVTIELKRIDNYFLIDVIDTGVFTSSCRIYNAT